MSKTGAFCGIIRNINAYGMRLKEGAILLAAAELLSKAAEITSHEVCAVIGENRSCETMRQMKWWLHCREGINDRGKKTYYFRLTEEGIEKVISLLTVYKAPTLAD